MKLSFHKLVGAGNDFVFVKANDIAKQWDRRQLAKMICDRQWGIGADGFVIMEQQSGDSLYQWDFYNSDGSSAEMCGNAARCAIRFIKDQFNNLPCQMETLAGTVHGDIQDQVHVTWQVQTNQLKQQSVDLENFKTFEGFFINTGVPHFVILNRASDISLDDCLAIQQHPIFGEAQTNVTLLDIQEDGTQQTKTFERGVRNYTLACGTGVIASAFVLQNIKPQSLYELEAPGGVLGVQIQDKTVTLIGPGENVFSGHYHLPKEILS